MCLLSREAVTFAADVRVSEEPGWKAEGGGEAVKEAPSILRSS